MTDFTAYAFSATGPTGAFITNITTPDRLSRDVVNVKDWGALGDGLTDDTAAIQAACDFANTFDNPIPGLQEQALRGIFFPAGTYIVTSTITVTLTTSTNQGSTYIFGAGRNATIIKGNVSGYIFVQDFHAFNVGWMYRDMTLWNQSTANGTGAMIAYLGQHRTAWLNMRFVGVNGLSYSNENYGADIRNCIALNSRVYTSGPFASPTYPTANNYTPMTEFEFYSGDPNASVGFIHDQVYVRNCVADGYDYGFLALGQDFGNAVVAQAQAPGFICNRAVRCKVGFGSGGGSNVFSGGANGGGCTWVSNYADRCQVALYGTLDGSSAFCTVVDGVLGAADPAPIQQITWSGGTATVTTVANHNISTNPIQLQLSSSASAWTPNHTGLDAVTVTTIGPTTFTYSLANPGASSISNPGGWTYPLQSGIIPKDKCVVGPNTFLGQIRGPSIDHTELGAANGQCAGQSIFCTHAPNWGLVPSSNGFGGSDRPHVKYISCSSPSGTVVPPFSYMTFAEATAYYPSLARGQAFNIIDGQSASIGGAVTGGGGSNHYKIMWNGSSWIRAA